MAMYEANKTVHQYTLRWIKKKKKLKKCHSFRNTGDINTVVLLESAENSAI